MERWAEVTESDGAWAERGAGGCGAGTERRAGSPRNALSDERLLSSHSTHVLWSSDVHWSDLSHTCALKWFKSYNGRIQHVRLGLTKSLQWRDEQCDVDQTAESSTKQEQIERKICLQFYDEVPSACSPSAWRSAWISPVSPICLFVLYLTVDLVHLIEQHGGDDDPVDHVTSSLCSFVYQSVWMTLPPRRDQIGCNSTPARRSCFGVPLHVVRASCLSTASCLTSPTILRQQFVFWVSTFMMIYPDAHLYILKTTVSCLVALRQLQTVRRCLPLVAYKSLIVRHLKPSFSNSH